MLLLGNWGQQIDIEDQRREIEDLRTRLDSGAREGDTTLKSRVTELEKENSELRLYLHLLSGTWDTKAYCARMSSASLWRPLT